MIPGSGNNQRILFNQVTDIFQAKGPDPTDIFYSTFKNCKRDCSNFDEISVGVQLLID